MTIKHKQHDAQQALCPTRNPNRPRLAPLTPPFSMRTPTFQHRHTLQPPTPSAKPERDS
ncbi:hypothetical protein JW897_02240 [Chromobacterium alkanivorans]|uniref:hypothetical protein n=1 Tax=Chromobacterium alkanivorans TaxID=1071719 RepID=UPI001968143E|nr:hypothetical protein [Chromobacterium alkanivorans]MBN3002549.1 hypothetical protein [Chromobacterium alkanivorans]